MRSFLIAALLYSLTQVAPVAANDGEVDGWILSQTVRETGNLQVYVCKSALRIYMPKNGLVVLASAPWKEAALYCTKTGNIYRTKLSDFHNPYIKTMTMFDGEALCDVEVALKGTTESVGLPCKYYIEKPGFKQKQLAKKRNGTVTGRAPLELKYIVTDELKLDPHIGQTISKFYSLPSTDSVPLQFIYINVVHERDTQLTTLSCKRAKLRTAQFRVPPGLKAVNEGMSVLVPDRSDGALDLMMMGQSKVK